MRNDLKESYQRGRYNEDTDQSLRILKKGLCTKCNVDYYPIEKDPENIGEYINCYKDPEGYYLDINAELYKRCHYTCKTCEMKGNYLFHN